ncbi:MAG: DUF4126 domain-containing protein [Moorea sp. SIO2B7]|nr:DUF4126 domain-containing protein [Moorena sp. SIO2B7]
MLIGVLAVLSASAAAGMRIALPLLIIGLLQNEALWSNVPILSYIHPQVLIAILTSWSLFELFGSKKLLGQRILQLIQLVFSPLVGALMGITVANIIHLEITPLWLIGIVGGLLALVLKLVQVGWFFRLRGIPIWVVFIEDTLCIFLVLFAFKAPEQGGLIAMLLLWLAIRSSKEWHRWYQQKNLPGAKD